MKKYLIAVSAALILVGCARDNHTQGGMKERSGSQIGSGSVQGVTNSIESSSSVTNSSGTTNSSSGTPANSTGTSSGANAQGSQSDRSSGAGSDDNRTPKPDGSK